MIDAINTNVIALQTQDNLNNSQSSLGTSIERLSSGLRINSASDDPAGLAIAARMTSQLSGINQATTNANTGVSMLQTADGGLASATAILQTMRGLAVEAANGTNSSSDLASLQAEMTQSQAELQQISTTTQYNGINLIDGSLSNLQFQVGANSGQTIDFGIGTAQESAIGNNTVALTGAAGNAAGDAITEGGALAAAGSEKNNVIASTLNVEGNGATTAVTVTAGESAQSIATSVNAGTANTGVTATASAQAVMTFTGTGNVSFNIVGTSTSPITASYSAAAGYSNVVSAINEQTGNTGVTASLGQGGIVLSNSTGANIDVQNTGTAANVKVAGFTNAGAVGAAQTLTTGGTATSAVVVGGTLQFNSPNGFSTNDTTASNGLFAAAGSTGSTLASVGSINVTTTTNGTPTGANSALQIIDAAIANINANRANIGALENRFTSAASNLQTSSLNLTSSLSTEQDTNFASETTNLSRAQVLQQAGTAMLAQANQLPSGVLALLR